MSLIKLKNEGIISDFFSRPTTLFKEMTQSTISVITASIINGTMMNQQILTKVKYTPI